MAGHRLCAPHIRKNGTATADILHFG